MSANEPSPKTYFEIFVKYFWSDQPTINEVLPFLMLVNTLIIAILIGVIASGLAWHYRSNPDERFHRQVVRGFMWPTGIALLIWLLYYPIRTLYAANPGTLLDQCLGEFLSSLAGVGILVAGLTLIRFPKTARAHSFLSPSTAKEDVGGARRKRIALAVSILGGTLLLADWALLVLGLRRDVEGYCAFARLVGNCLSCIALASLGWGILLELNKNRVYPMARAAGWSMILYGLLQLLLVNTERLDAINAAFRCDLPAVGALFAFLGKLTLVTFTLGLLFKTILAFTLFGFFVMVVEARRARLNAVASWKALLGTSAWGAGVMARQVNAQHTMRTTIGLLRTIAEARIGAAEPDSRDSADWTMVRKLADDQKECNEAFTSFDPWRVGAYPRVGSAALEAKLHDVARDFRRDGAYKEVTVVGEMPSNSYFVPLEELREMLHRVLENGPREGAAKARIEYRLIDDLLVLKVENDGRPFSAEAREDAFLRRDGGLWVAKKLSIDLGGDLDILSDVSSCPRFRIRIPVKQTSEVSDVISPEDPNTLLRR